MKALKRLLQWVLITIVISGCSTVRIGYDQVDHLGYWWVDRYLDLNSDKSPQFKADLKALHAWHRQSQLPEYARLSSSLASRVEGDLSSTEICEDIQAVREKLEILARQSLHIWVRLSLQLGPEEIRYLRKKFAKEDKEWRAKWLDPSPEKIQRLRSEEWIDRAESFYGRLNDEQRRFIQQSVSHSSWDARISWERRQQRQQRIIATLEKIMQQHLSQSEAEAELKVIIEQLLMPDDPRQASMQRKLTDEACVNLSGLHKLTRADQRLLASEKFNSYATDFRYLIRNR